MSRDLPAPIIKWVGGKAWLAETLASTVGVACREAPLYVEPFAGGLGSFCALRAAGYPGRAILGDMNADLVLLHKAVQQQPQVFYAGLEALWKHAQEGAYGKADFVRTYHAVRDSYNRGGQTDLVRACLLVWLLRNGYNGLYRVSRSGRFNVPPADKPGALPDLDSLRRLSQALANTRVVHSDAIDLLTTLLDFPRELAGVAYLDPPYLPQDSQVGSFTSYTQSGFSLDKQQQLVQLGQRLAERGWKVFASNHDCKEARRLYAGWDVLATPQRFNRVSSHLRTHAGEVLFGIG